MCLLLKINLTTDCSIRVTHYRDIDCFIRVYRSAFSDIQPKFLVDFSNILLKIILA